MIAFAQSVTDWGGVGTASVTLAPPTSEPQKAAPQTSVSEASTSETSVSPIRQVSDPVSFTAQARVLMNDSSSKEDTVGATGEEEASFMLAEAETSADEEIDFEPTLATPGRIVESMVVSRLQEQDSMVREGGQVPAGAWLQLGPDDRWYAVGGLAREGLTELGPSAHELSDNFSVRARFAAKFEDVGQLE